MYKHTHLEIDINNKSDRIEWGHARYQSVYRADRAFELVVQWVTSSGTIVAELVSKRFCHRATYVDCSTCWYADSASDKHQTNFVSSRWRLDADVLVFLQMIMVNLYELNDVIVMSCSSLQISVYAVETDVSLIMADICKAVSFYLGEFSFNPFMFSFPRQLMLLNWVFEVCYKGKSTFKMIYPYHLLLRYCIVVFSK